MTRKQQRMVAVALVLCGIGLAVGLSLYAMRNNVSYFRSPTAILSAEAHHKIGNRSIRLGGVVVYGTVEKKGMVTNFVVTDYKNDIPVTYTGIVPDLFREGKGVVAIGRYDEAAQLFKATQILAKHDENYMPPDVAKILKEGKGPHPSSPMKEEGTLRGGTR